MLAFVVSAQLQQCLNRLSFVIHIPNRAAKLSISSLQTTCCNCHPVVAIFEKHAKWPIVRYLSKVTLTALAMARLQQCLNRLSFDIHIPNRAAKLSISSLQTTCCNCHPVVAIFEKHAKWPIVRYLSKVAFTALAMARLQQCLNHFPCALNASRLSIHC